MQNKVGFKEGEPWGENARVDHLENANGERVSSWSRSSCCAKARQMQAYVMGDACTGPDNAIRLENHDLKQIKPGDVLHYIQLDGREHYVFVIAVNENSISIGQTYSKKVDYRDISLDKFKEYKNIDIYRVSR